MENPKTVLEITMEVCARELSFHPHYCGPCLHCAWSLMMEQRQRENLLHGASQFDRSNYEPWS